MPKQFAVNNPGFHEIRDVLVDAGFQIWLEDKVDILTFLANYFVFRYTPENWTPIHQWATRQTIPTPIGAIPFVAESSTSSGMIRASSRPNSHQNQKYYDMSAK